MDSPQNASSYSEVLLDSIESLNYDDLIDELDRLIPSIKRKLEIHKQYQVRTQNEKIKLDDLLKHKDDELLAYKETQEKHLCQMNDKNNQINDNSNKLYLLSNQYKELEHSIQGKELDIIELNKQINNLNNEVNNLKAENTSLKAESNNLKNEFKEQKYLDSKNIDERSKIISELTEKNIELEKESANYKAQITEVKNNFLYKKYIKAIDILKLDFFNEKSIEKIEKFNSLNDEIDYEREFSKHVGTITKEIYNYLYSVNYPNSSSDLVEKFSQEMESEFQIINPKKNELFNLDYHHEVNRLSDEDVDSNKIIRTTRVGIINKDTGTIYKASVEVAS